MKIAEVNKTHHDIICIHSKPINDKIHETWVDVCTNDKKEVLVVAIDDTEISAFHLEVLAFLKKAGKI